MAKVGKTGIVSIPSAAPNNGWYCWHRVHVGPLARLCGTQCREMRLRCGNIWSGSPPDHPDAFLHP